MGHHNNDIKKTKHRRKRVTKKQKYRCEICHRNNSRKTRNRGTERYMRGGDPITNWDEIQELMIKGKFEHLKQILDQNNINQRDKFGYTPLHLFISLTYHTESFMENTYHIEKGARQDQIFEFARWMIDELGADITIASKKRGRTPLITLINYSNSNKKLLKLLVKKTKNIDEVINKAWIEACAKIKEQTLLTYALSMLEIIPEWEEKWSTVTGRKEYFMNKTHEYYKFFAKTLMDHGAKLTNVTRKCLKNGIPQWAIEYGQSVENARSAAVAVMGSTRFDPHRTGSTIAGKLIAKEIMKTKTDPKWLEASKSQESSTTVKLRRSKRKKIKRINIE